MERDLMKRGRVLQYLTVMVFYIRVFIVYAPPQMSESRVRLASFM